MLQADGLSSSLVTLILAFVMSWCGALLGALAIGRSRALRGKHRLRWNMLAAFGFGITGMWSAFLTATLGLGYLGVVFAYGTSALVLGFAATAAVCVLALQLAAGPRIGTGGRTAGGILLGGAVLAAFYLTMASLRLTMTITFSTESVAVSAVVALIAGVLTVHFAVAATKRAAVFLTAIALPVAMVVVYTSSLLSATVHQAAAASGPAGTPAAHVLLPLIIVVMFGTLIALFLVGVGPTQRDEAGEERIAEMYQQIAGSPNRR